MSEEPARVLIVEDEAHIAAGLRFNLEAEGYRADVVETGEAALESASRYDVVVLDVMLPGIDGFQVAADLRRAGCFVPIVMLTARGSSADILKGFESGADDYLPKPFDLSILIARVGGLLRRSAWVRQSAMESDQVRVDDRTIDFRTMEIRGGEHVFPMTLMEANLLRYLVNHAGEAIPRRRLLEDVWGVREDTDTRAIDNFIVRLRRYLEDEPGQPKHLLTVRGVGYRFVS
jgi:two-component system alkaline phosphatase synthesis response regulator PhoP